MLLLLKVTEKCRLPSLALPLVIFDACPSTIKSRFSLPVPSADWTVPLPSTFRTVRTNSPGWRAEADPSFFFGFLDVHGFTELSSYARPAGIGNNNNNNE
ncbi:hypothetical protein CEXT_512541 [Caerostris extrusa]|uniref:Uncharacterized protein n=1 Tax=Caerostris extrusa TaxID=172846 RepID=A0AAV4N680_CAEEX|nr:hypothetical protein CEXT_512541 [Caerostris extrusa]